LIIGGQIGRTRKIRHAGDEIRLPRAPALRRVLDSAGRAA